MNADALTMTREGLVGEIYDIAAKWRLNPRLSGDSAEIARYNNVRAALKIRFTLNIAIRGEQDANDYRATLAFDGR
jgi:hypothetical protein